LFGNLNKPNNPYEAPDNSEWRKTVPLLYCLSSDQRYIIRVMSKPAKNAALHAANKAKNDEFYTQLSDIENECGHYWDHFSGKTILCN
jgi:hypothetical protein